jgi:hypothetical protein
LLDQIPSVVKGKGYEKSISDNLIAALTTRIQSLRYGWKKQLFDQPFSTPWQDIFDRPVVINLSYLGDDADKAFTMALLLQFLYEYRQVQHSVLNPVERRKSSLRHLTIIEEAHRILLRTMSGSVAQADPQGKVSEMFANRLVAADDRDAMSACMNLTLEQSAIINRLRPGQAIICGEQDDLAAWVQIKET